MNLSYTTEDIDFIFERGELASSYASTNRLVISIKGLDNKIYRAYHVTSDNSIQQNIAQRNKINNEPYYLKLSPLVQNKILDQFKKQGLDNITFGQSTIPFVNGKAELIINNNNEILQSKEPINTFDPEEKPLSVKGDIKSFKPSIDKNKVKKISDLYK